MLNPMKLLGGIVKEARARLDYTQVELAEIIDKSERTIIKIEQGEDNLRLDSLFPLIRTLKIDPRELFYPEAKQEKPSVQALRYMIEDCSEEDAAALIPVIQAYLKAIKGKQNIVDFK